MRQSTRLIGAALASALIVACGVTTPSTTAPPTSPGPSPPPAASFAAVEIAEWIEFRERSGLRADRHWVVRVASDPNATWDLDTPLMPSEFEQWVAAHKAAGTLLEQVTSYGEKFPTDWAGAYLEGPTVVALFSQDMAAHEVALGALFGGRSVNVRAVEWSLAELERFERQIEADVDWFDTISAAMVDVGLDPMGNGVQLAFQGANTGRDGPSLAAERAIRDHFGDTGWLQLDWLGPLPWMGPRGDLLEIAVVDERGRPVFDLRCHLIPLDLQALDWDDYFKPEDDGVCRIYELAAVEYAIQIEEPWPLGETGPGKVRATARTRVDADAVARVTVAVRD